MNEPAGRILAIYIARRPHAPMEPVAEAHLLPGRGLEGDRHFTEADEHDPSAELTLIEAEAVEAAEREFSIALGPGAARRNLVTRGVALNGLVGRKFQAGEVLLEGIRLCHPCAHLESLTAPGVRRALKDRGGLRARIVTEGRLRPGDPVRALPPDPSPR